MNSHNIRLPSAVFATSGHAKMSEKYEHISTANILDSLQSGGFEVVKARAANQRASSDPAYAKHMVELTHPNLPSIEGHQPRVMLRNSHDGSSAFSFMAGVFRLVCSNGLIVGSAFARISVRHIGNGVAEKAVLAATSTVASFPQTIETIQRAMSVQLDRDQHRELLVRVLELRFGEEWRNRFISESRALNSIDAARRYADDGTDLWRVFNRAQENAMRGGFGVYASSGRRGRAREVSGLDRTIDLNRSMWDVMESYLPKQAA
jgi:hypothetical protein